EPDGMIEKAGPPMQGGGRRGVRAGAGTRLERVAGVVAQARLAVRIEHLPGAMTGEVEVAARLALAAQEATLDEKRVARRIVLAHGRRHDVPFLDAVAGAINVEIETQAEEVLMIDRHEVAGNQFAVTIGALARQLAVGVGLLLAERTLRVGDSL